MSPTPTRRRIKRLAPAKSALPAAASPDPAHGRWTTEKYRYPPAKPTRFRKRRYMYRIIQSHETSKTKRPPPSLGKQRASPLPKPLPEATAPGTGARTPACRAPTRFHYGGKAALAAERRQTIGRKNEKPRQIGPKHPQSPRDILWRNRRFGDWIRPICKKPSGAFAFFIQGPRGPLLSGGRAPLWL